MVSPLWNLTPWRTLNRSVLSSGYDQAVARCGLKLPLGSLNTSGSAMWMAGLRLASDCSMLASRVVIGNCWITVTAPDDAAAVGLAAGAAWVGATVDAVCGWTGAAIAGAAVGAAWAAGLAASAGFAASA